jgi:signal transduction histidine kinase
MDQCLSETRTLSHLLHPPLLDEAGFASAARWYVEGFAKRSGLAVSTDIPSDLPRLRSNMELCLFRILQESLTNVHRHSGCTHAAVKVEFDAEAVSLTITDNGHGIPPERLRQLRETSFGLGIGLAGMRERATELGGRLIFDSDASGTMVMASMPVMTDCSEQNSKVLRSN